MDPRPERRFTLVEEGVSVEGDEPREELVEVGASGGCQVVGLRRCR
jgi:hypothetical protein